jgi:hypothetical protein
MFTKFFARRTSSAASRFARLSVQELEPRDVPATFLWAGGAGGAANENLWDHRPNWVLLDAAGEAGFPVVGSRLGATARAFNSTDIITFTNAHDTECMITTNQEVGSLVIDGFTGKLQLNADLTVHGGSLKTLTLDHTKYTIGGPNDLIIAQGALFTWYSGTIAGVNSSDVIVKAGATLNIESDDALTKDARLAGGWLRIDAATATVAAGVVNLSSGHLYLQKTSYLQQGASRTIILNQGEFNVTGTALRMIETTGADSLFYQYGKFRLNLAQPNEFRFAIRFFDVPAEQATWTIQKGHLHLSVNDSTTNKVWAIANGQTVVFDKHDAVQPPTITWSGARFEGDGKVIVEGARIVIPKDKTTFINKLDFISGTLHGEAPSNDPGQLDPSVLSVSAQMVWTGGATTGKGTINVKSTAQLTIAGRSGYPTSIVGEPTLTGWRVWNRGVVQVGKAAADENLTSTNFRLSANAIVDNWGEGDMKIVDTSNILLTAGQELGVIQVADTAKFRKVLNAGVSTVQAEVNSATGAEINVSKGSTVIRKAGNNQPTATIHGKGEAGGVSFRGPANFDAPFGVAVGGELGGDAEITTATFTNEGTVLPGEANSAGALVFVGNFTQTVTGALALELGGGANAVGGTHYDQVTIAEGGNQLTLAGALQLSALPTLAATAGTVFGIIDNQSSLNVSGTFSGLAEGASVTLGGYTFTISYVGKLNPSDQYNNDVTLTVVSVPTVTLTGRVWNDTVQNGIQDAGEGGVAGVQIQLLDANWNVIAVTYTNSNGDYSFANIAAGQYRLRVIPPPTAVFVPPNIGGDDDIDSDFNTAGESDLFTVPPGGSADFDAGLFGGGIIIEETTAPPP